jgi:DNA-binding NarL/FixJ family response regulator
VKVLVVDDSKIVRERLKGMLSEVPKVEAIDEAKDQQEARELLGKLNPDVVITDIQMPDGSGIGLLREVKKKGKKLPMLIVLTNQSYPQYRKKCLEAGVDFFFDKSIEFDKVAEVLNQLDEN